MHALQAASQISVPKIPNGSLKSFWNSDLDRLKEASVDMHKLWRTIGSPRHGIINSARLKAKLDYKKAIKLAAVQFECNNAHELYTHFIYKETSEFWKCWNTKYRKSLDKPTSVARQSDPIGIANEFKNYCSNIVIDSSKDKKAM